MNERSFIILMPRLTHHAKKTLVQERQQQILQAAAQVFAEKGFDGATIRDIARAAGVSEGSIYLYFKNKQDLLVHLPRQFMQPPVDALRSAIADSDTPPSPEELLQFVAKNIVHVVTHNRELMRVLFTSLPMMDEETRSTYMREGPAYAVETIEKYIRAQQAAGVFRDDLNPTIAARILPGMMLFFLLIQEILKPKDLERFEYDEVIPNVISIFLYGVSNEEPKPLPKPTSTPLPKAAAKPGPQARPRKRKQSIQIE
jgi:TetR/AcrR family transcriptional regulator, fatty acid metabolism regulator protein